MKTRIFGIGVLLQMSAFSSVFAADASSNPTLNAGTFNYAIPQQNFLGSNLPALLQKGGMLGIIQDNDPTGLQKPSDIKGYFEAMALAAQKRVNDLKAGLGKAVPLSPPSPLTPPTTAPSGPPATQPVLAAVPEARLDFQKFKSCAQDILPQLRMAIALQNQSAGQQGDDDSAQIISDRLNELRFDGTQMSAVGTICGQYLGLMATESLSLTQDAKTLMSFVSSQSDAESELLLMTYTATFHKNSPVVGNLLWRSYWAAQSVATAFRAAADSHIPSLDELMPTFKDSDFNSVAAAANAAAVTVTGITIDIAKLTQLGRSFATQLLQTERSKP